MFPCLIDTLDEDDFIVYKVSHFQAKLTSNYKTILNQSFGCSLTHYVAYSLIVMALLLYVFIIVREENPTSN